MAHDVWRVLKVNDRMTTPLAFFSRIGQPVPNAAPTQRMEQKFYVPPSKIPFAACLLRHCCRADRNFPKGIVNSVYYDTPDLRCLSDSDEGNHNRDKVRIRWYDVPLPSSETTSAYLELKSKTGYAGTKQRKRFCVPTSRFTKTGLRGGLLDAATLRETLFQFGYIPNQPIHPTICISYYRLRFEDILTGVRISLDWKIRSFLVSPHLDRREGILSMHGGVIEIKGPSMDIPPALRSVRFLATDWGRYSKFASCLEAQLEDPGSVGRCWPSGRVEVI